MPQGGGGVFDVFNIPLFCSGFGRSLATLGVENILETFKWSVCFISFIFTMKQGPAGLQVGWKHYASHHSLAQTFRSPIYCTKYRLGILTLTLQTLELNLKGSWRVMVETVVWLQWSPAHLTSAFSCWVKATGKLISFCFSFTSDLLSVEMSLWLKRLQMTTEKNPDFVFCTTFWFKYCFCWWNRKKCLL